MLNSFFRFNLCYWTDVRWHREHKTKYIQEFKNFARIEKGASL